jgi:hypothetical protein
MPTTYAIPDGRTVMAATLYTGTGATQTISNSANGVSFQPDFVWVKGRSGATDHALYDAVRGVQKQIESNSSGAETTETTGLTAFGSTGFTIGALAQMNTSAATYVAWQWNAGGSTVTNTSGSISAQVRANTTAGCSVVTYTGTGSAATIGHGLGVAPAMIIVKSRSAVQSWVVYHQSNGASPQNNVLFLNLTDASSAIAGAWNNTAPTSTLITLGNSSGAGTNTTSATYVAYCFAPVAGYSAFGKYTGNGSADGPFVYTGFRPRWVMIKRTDANENWQMYDTSRNTSNVVGEYLLANSSGAGATITVLDFLSNGFKIRVDGTNPGANTSGGTYVYACFSENPFKFANAR